MIISLTKKLILLVCLSPISLCHAIQTQDKWWSLLTLTGNYGAVLYNVEPQIRFVYADKPFQQFLNNSGVGYQFTSHWQAWFGQTLSADSQDAVAGDQDEYRLWQQIVWTDKFNNDQLIVRSRLEERMSFYFSDTAYRFRGRVSYSTPLFSNLSGVLVDEFFINVNQASWVITHPFDQNRAFIGVEQKLSKTTSLLTGYLNQFLNFSTKPRQINSVLVVNIKFNLEWP